MPWCVRPPITHLNGAHRQCCFWFYGYAHTAMLIWLCSFWQGSHGQARLALLVGMLATCSRGSHELLVLVRATVRVEAAYGCRHSRLASQVVVADSGHRT